MDKLINKTLIYINQYNKGVGVSGIYAIKDVLSFVFGFNFLSILHITLAILRTSIDKFVYMFFATIPLIVLSFVFKRHEKKINEILNKDVIIEPSFKFAFWSIAILSMIMCILTMILWSQMTTINSTKAGSVTFSAIVGARHRSHKSSLSQSPAVDGVFAKNSITCPIWAIVSVLAHNFGSDGWQKCR